MSKIELVMDEVYEKLLDKLLEIIKKDVYEAYEPEFYERTEDLLNPKNWGVKRTKRKGKTYRTLFYKGEQFTEVNMNADIHSPDAYIHGNYLYGAFEQKSFLAMLNGKTKDYGDNPFNFPQINRKPFWDDFLLYCDRQYKRLFNNACKRYGIPIK